MQAEQGLMNIKTFVVWHLELIMEHLDSKVLGGHHPPALLPVTHITSLLSPLHFGGHRMVPASPSSWGTIAGWALPSQNHSDLEGFPSKDSDPDGDCLSYCSSQGLRIFSSSANFF